MRTVDMHEAETHPARLVEGAAQGEPFIARAGKPLVKVLAVDAPPSGTAARTGFLAGRISLPSDFDRMSSGEIEGLYEGSA